MFGLSTGTKEALDRIIDDLFDGMALRLLGEMPGLRHKKLLIFTIKPKIGLPHLFLEALGNNYPNYLEQDAMKGLLKQSFGFLEALKLKTKNSVLERIDARVRESRNQGESGIREEFKKIIDEEFEKAGAGLKMISESEATKSRNIGHMMNIGKVASASGDLDPNVFFLVKKDRFTCEHCVRNHFVPDGKTPKVFKFSEIKQGFLNKQEVRDGKVSVCGQHPNCKCSISYLSPGFGFKNGKLAWIGLDHDEHVAQKT